MKDDNSFEDLTKKKVTYINPFVELAIDQITGHAVPGSERCDRCGRSGATRTRQNTAYDDEKANWETLCPECQEEGDAYWKEMWRDYYASVL